MCVCKPYVHTYVCLTQPDHLCCLAEEKGLVMLQQIFVLNPQTLGNNDCYDKPKRFDK